VAFAVAIDHATQLLNGERVTDTQTPLGSLTQMLDGRSENDAQRQRGEQDYARALEGVSRAAAEWTPSGRVTHRAASSAPSRTATTLVRGTHAGPVRVGTSMTIDCRAWFDAVKTRADAVRAEMDKAGEVARQRGVFPGTTRDLRRRYRMQWAGWDR
jgi:hypothetical protein